MCQSDRRHGTDSADDNWSGVDSIVAYRGDGLTRLSHFSAVHVDTAAAAAAAAARRCR
jgi:hypothetical protein